MVEIYPRLWHEDMLKDHKGPNVSSAYALNRRDALRLLYGIVNEDDQVTTLEYQWGYLQHILGVMAASWRSDGPYDFREDCSPYE